MIVSQIHARIVAPAKMKWMATSVTVLLALLVMYVRQVGVHMMYSKINIYGNSAIHK